MPLTGTTTSGLWPDKFYADRVHFEVTRNANGPGKFASREPLTERRAHPVTGIRQYTAEVDTGRNDAVNFGQCHLWLRSCSLMFGRNPRPLQTYPIARPTLGKEEAQCHHYRYFTTRERQRHQRLAVGGLAQGRSILWRDTDRVLALLRHRRVVDDQYGI